MAPISMPAPFVIAHRAGNDLARLRAAESLRIPLVEADVHLYAGRLEVRHLKTVGPLPLLWDRWTLAPPWTPRLKLEELLEARAPGTELMLDLKGHDPRLPGRVAAALQAGRRRQQVTVCSQNWRFLDALRERADTRVVHSVGSSRQLARLRRRYAGERLEGISIHRKLLDPAVVHELRDRSRLVMSWPVQSVADVRQLSGWGVQGMITTDFERLAPSLAELRVAA